MERGQQEQATTEPVTGQATPLEAAEATGLALVATRPGAVGTLASSRGGAALQRQVGALQRAAGNRAVSRVAASHAPRTLARWTELGAVSWDVKWGDKIYHGKTAKVWVGTKTEWLSILDNIDDEDEYYRHLQGFLWVANDPGWVSGARSNHPSSSQPAMRDFYQNYRSTVSRAPNSTEKLAFLEALYEKGDALDLWHGGTLEGGPWIREADSDIAKFIENNQGLYLEALAKTGQGMKSKPFKAVADQGGKRATIAMIINGGASAFKGVDLIASGASHGDQLIQNAGHAIRYALEAYDARIAFEKKLVGNIFDTVWGVIPGGGTLTSLGKDILKTALKEAMDSAMSEDGPKEQAEAILLKFIKGCNELKTKGELDEIRSRLAITSFEAAMR